MSPRGPVRPLRSAHTSTPKVEVKPEEKVEKIEPPVEELLPTTPVEPEVVPPTEPEIIPPAEPEVVPPTSTEPEIVPPVEPEVTPAPPVEPEAVPTPPVEPEVKVEEPKPLEAEAPKVENLGTLGGKRILSMGKQEANGKIYNKITCEDKTTYLLTDHDVEEQVEK